MKSLVTKRSIIIGGHKTSVSLEDAFWNELKAIASARDIKLSELVTTVDSTREYGNLSSALRLFVLSHYRREPDDQHLAARGHRRAPKKARALVGRR
jgi:predicted DNA-binding ribbon-helix-helix protein